MGGCTYARTTVGKFSMPYTGWCYWLFEDDRLWVIPQVTSMEILKTTV